MENEQRAVTFIKPGHLEQSAEIFNYLNTNLRKDFLRSVIQYFYPSFEQMDEFYFHTRGESFHVPTIQRYVKEGICFCVYRGIGIIEEIRFWVGDTDPCKAEQWTIRGKFGTDSLQGAFRDVRFLENVFHSPKTLEDAAREERILGFDKIAFNWISQ